MTGVQTCALPIYGGEGYINPRMKKAVEKKADGCEQSIKVKMAALSVSIWQVTV